MVNVCLVKRSRMMDEAKVIQSLLSEFEKERALGNKALKQLPRGDLRITRNGPGRISIFREYYYENTRKRKGIGSDKELVYQLAHKAFLQEKLRRLDENILRLRQMKTDLLSLDPADILAALPKHFDILEPQRIIAPDAGNKLDYPNPVFNKSILAKYAPLDTGGLTPYEWACRPYRANTSNPEHLIHRTSKGVWTRSKGEVLVIERYDALNIPYHYDEVIELEDGVFRSPDIIAARADRRLIYHEHAGYQTDDYQQGLLEKLQLYAAAGIYLGVNLILTFDDENGGINLPLVDALIRDMHHI